VPTPSAIGKVSPRVDTLGLGELQALGDCNFRGTKGLFAIDWLPDGLATLRSASNGRYVTARLNGGLQATVDQSSVGDRERFTLTVANRPRLFLKCDHGFVGVKSSAAASPARAECNRAFSDPVALVPVRHVLKEAGGAEHASAAYCLRGNNKPLFTTSKSKTIIIGVISQGSTDGTPQIPNILPGVQAHP